MTTKQKFALLGADNWQSYAYFRAGVRYAEEGNARAARDMYYRALASSPNNIGACLNLAILDALVDPKDEESNPHALSLLEHVKKRVQEAKSADKNVSLSPPWYVATYQLAAAYDYQDKVWLAATEARRLVMKINNTIEHLKTRERSSWIPFDRRRREVENEDILRFLSELKPLAVIMLAAILLRTEGEEAANEQLAAVLRREGEEAENEQPAEVTDPNELHYRARYNLACFHSRLGELKRGAAREKAYRSTLDDLRYAFQRKRSLVEHARADKSLREVRKAKATDFENLIKRYARPTLPQPADQLDLADLESVGEVHAKQLKQQGIVSRDDLVAKAGTPAARRRLAEKTGIRAVLLQRWALLADMMRVAGADIPQANLMVAADVDSLKALKKCDANELALLLHQVNQARSLVKQPPEVETVRNWVSKAKDARRMVKPDRFIW